MGFVIKKVSFDYHTQNPISTICTVPDLISPFQITLYCPSDPILHSEQTLIFLPFAALRAGLFWSIFDSIINTFCLIVFLNYIERVSKLTCVSSRSKILPLYYFSCVTAIYAFSRSSFNTLVFLMIFKSKYPSQFLNKSFYHQDLIRITFPFFDIFYFHLLIMRQH
ncbi:hypothetical protein BpHYR1_023762 [Brachionus plicatilis]|uniref:Uncharacterized protein n=1 Tax=Brachionus plicatilis TaxID=10195 RepID=A0A3M7SMI8_BRAPC|nr:hypothetical protein BpHYR1_023762 [Brachionus plicatilis]